MLFIEFSIVIKILEGENYIYIVDRKVVISKILRVIRVYIYYILLY